MKLKNLLILFLTLVTSYSYAQQRIVTGMVVDNSGLPLLGVSIVIKGTSKGTQTDFDGKYSIVVNTGDILSFSYIGFTPKDITVTNTSDVINVTMDESAESLKEVVVTALGIKKQKRSLGYATQEVGSKELTEARNPNALNALSGKVAGVQISNNSANLGGSTRILIRGVNSITQDNRPLIVVDGLPLNISPLGADIGATSAGFPGRDNGDLSFDINPDDVESISVLKSSAAATLYGTRAANGVILITTKSGEKGRTEITLNSGVTFSSPLVLPKIQKLYGAGRGDANTIEQPTDFIQETIDGTTYDRVEFLANTSWGPRFDPNRLVLHWDALDREFAEDFLKPRPWVYPENDRNSFWDTGVEFNNGVTISTGSEKLTGRLSLNNRQTTGIVPNTSTDRTSLGLNTEIQVTDKFETRITADLFFQKSKLPLIGSGTGSLPRQLYQFGQAQLDFERLKKYKTAEGVQRLWNRFSAQNPNGFLNNPYWIIFENIAESQRNRFRGSVEFTYNFLEELYLQGSVFGDTNTFTNSNRTAVGSVGAANVGAYGEVKSSNTQLTYQARLHFNKDLFDDKWNIETFIGLERLQSDANIINGNTRGGLRTPNFYNLSNSRNNFFLTATSSSTQTNSLLGSFSVGYNRIVHLNLTARNDWASTLPVKNNSNLFAAIDGNIVFSELIDAKWLSSGIIRGGYAEVGNNPPVSVLADNISAQLPFLNVPLFELGVRRQSNPNLVVEKTRELELGVEMAFFKNRFNFDVTYYRRRTRDLLQTVTIPVSTGFSAVFTNAGTLENKGIEAIVNITPIQTPNFSWGVTWNFGKNESKLLDLFGETENIQISSYVGLSGQSTPSLIAKVGEPYGVISGTNFVFDNQGNKVVDANGRYVSTQNREELGSILPDYNMGFLNSLRYKNFNLNFLVDIQQGGLYRSFTNALGHFSGLFESTVANNIREEGIVLPGVTGDVTFDRDGNYTVTNTAPNTRVISAQRYAQDFATGNDAQNIFRGDYIKLREIAMGYTFQELLGISSQINIRLFARNLFVWGLDNDNFDPEFAVSGSGNIQGGEGGGLPVTRSYGLNVQLNF